LGNKLTENQLVTTNDGSLSLLEPCLNEAYHSNAGALFEARSLYINGSGLGKWLENPKQKSLSVLDVGLGLGYNALAGIEAWLKASARVDTYLFSIEKNSQLTEELLSGQARWQKNWEPDWIDYVSGCSKINGGWKKVFERADGVKLTWLIRNLDATTLTNREFRADNWPQFNVVWQDPFSPKKNPELWSEAWFRLLREASEAKATLVTYSVARLVRDNLENAGWRWQKKPATGSKRWWLQAWPS